jgi:hypothetical protein
MSYREYGKNIKGKTMKNHEPFEEIVIPFKRDVDWQFERVLHNNSKADKLRLKNNTQKYAMWLWALVKGAHGKPLEDGEQYTMMGVHMSPSNVNYLGEFIGKWDMLCYAPVYDETVGDDEVRIYYCTDKKKLL